MWLCPMQPAQQGVTPCIERMLCKLWVRGAGHARFDCFELLAQKNFHINNDVLGYSAVPKSSVLR